MLTSRAPENLLELCDVLAASDERRLDSHDALVIVGRNVLQHVGPSSFKVSPAL
jgi:hypothetical protein